MLALLVLVLAPGLAIAAILALTVLTACGAWVAFARWRARAESKGRIDDDAPHLTASATRYRVGRRPHGGASEEREREQEQEEPQRWT